MNDHGLAYLGKREGPIRTPVIFKQGTITALQGADITPSAAAVSPTVGKRVVASKLLPVKKEAICDVRMQTLALQSLLDD